MRSHSRLAKTEKRKNIRRTFVFGLLTITTFTVFFFFGFPAILKFAAFLADVRKSGQPIEKHDTTPPPPPQFDPLPDATNNQKVNVSGVSEPGATIILFINKDQSEILSNKEGKFTFPVSLSKNDNSLYAIAKDGAGNESRKTEVYTIIYDSEPPVLEITNPQNESQYYGSKQRQVSIEGKSEEQATVYINDRFVYVNEDGSFSFATTLEEGENTFTIKAEDKAGNSIEKTLRLNFNE